MRTFTVRGIPEEKTFYGFDRNFTIESHRFALVMVEGEPEVWVLDNGPYAIRELDEYYRVVHGMQGLHFKIMEQSGMYSDPTISDKEAFPSSWK